MVPVSKTPATEMATETNQVRVTCISEDNTYYDIVYLQLPQ